MRENTRRVISLKRGIVDLALCAGALVFLVVAWISHEELGEIR